MAEAKPLKAGATGAEQFGGSDTIPVSALPSHTHALSNLTQSGAATGQVAKWNGSAWEPADNTGGSATDLSYTGTTSPVTLNSSTGADVTIVAGTNVTLSATGSALTINATSGGPSVISPSQLTADQDDYEPTGWDNATLVRLSSDVEIRGITGFGTTGISDGEVKKLVNVGSYPLYLAGEHPDSTASKRIGINGDYLLLAGKSVEIFYDNTSSRWRVLDPSPFPTNAYPRVVYREYTPGSTTAGDNSEVTLTAINSGSISSSSASGSQLPVVNLSTASTTNGGYSVSLGKSATLLASFGFSHISAECEMNVSQLSDGTNRFTTAFQITNGPTSTSITPNSTVGIRYTDNVNSGKWEGFSRDGSGSESTVDLGVTVATGTSNTYFLRIELNATNTEARFYINGAYCGRVTANMPAGQGCSSRVVIIKSAGSTSCTVGVTRIVQSAVYQI